MQDLQPLYRQSFWQPLWQPGQKIVLLVWLSAFMLSGCFFGQGQATPVAVNLPIYEPGASETASAPASDSETTPSSVDAVRSEESAPADDSGSDPAEASSDALTGRTVESMAADETAEAGIEAAASTATTAMAPALVATYAGEIAADERLVVVAETNGRVIELLVEIGDQVSIGDTLVRLDGTVLEAQRAQALSGVRAAKAQLDQVRNPVGQEELDAARAAVAAASAAYNRALAGATEEDRRLALAQLRQAEATVAVAQAGYNQVRYLPEVGMMPQGFQLQQATLAYEAAQARYDAIIKGATQDQIAGAYAQVVNAQAQLQRLEQGADLAQIRAAEAQVRAAENALYLAQLQLGKTIVAAPIAGIVASIQTSAGALAAPGAPVLTLLSSTVKVTIDVEETRLNQLRIGQPVRVRVAAYPERPVAGEVVLIAPQLDIATRTVTVTIRPNDPDRLLAPGMSTQVELLDE